MKLDILNRKWLDIVFEGRNKAYGAYELRRDNPRTTVMALLIGASIFSMLLSAPLLANFLPKEVILNEIDSDRVVRVHSEPKVNEPKIVTPETRAVEKGEVKKFVKLVVDNADNITEDPPKIDQIINTEIGSNDVSGDATDAPSLSTVTNGVANITEGDDVTNIYNSAGIQVQAQFPGGIDAFRAFIAKNFDAPTDYNFKGGQLYVSFIVEIDGSISNINVVRDPGYGTAAEAERVIKSNKTRWIAGEQNGRKVRMLFTLPITVQAPRN